MARSGKSHSRPVNVLTDGQNHRPAETSCGQKQYLPFGVNALPASFPMKNVPVIPPDHNAPQIMTRL